MTVTIEYIALTHAPGVAALSGQLGYPCDTATAECRIRSVIQSESDAGFVAFYRDQLIGWVHTFYTIRLETDAFCEIGGLVVDEQFRGMGVGKLLFAKAREWCQQKGCNVLRLRSNTIRRGAHLFYRHLGFAELKEQKVFELRAI